MCTAITYRTKDHYFGRNLDLEYTYHETVTVTPKNYAFHFRKAGTVKQHYAIIGMAYVSDNYPLYYDATNEAGLSMAGLHFPGNAHYANLCDATVTFYPKLTILSPFEFIPYILSRCASVPEAKEALNNILLADIPFNNELPNTPLHWLIADRATSVVVEVQTDGMHIYDNPVGILTNNPPFPQQLFQLNLHMQLSTGIPQNRFSPNLSLTPYSRGMGAIGLPGDLSSPSRFVRAAFVKENSVSGDGEAESVNQFFHILGSVEMQRGCIPLDNRQYDITVYSSCCNTDKGIYYYTTYDNRQIVGVDMHREDLEQCELISYPLYTDSKLHIINRHK